MTYLKVIWKHEPNEYPVIMYSELDDDRYETRKVEVFGDGTFGYAYDGGSSSMTILGEVPLPSFEEIDSDPQFEPVVISKNEFDKVWREAVSD